MSIWWSLQLRREAASVPLARRLLLGAMESAGVDADISHELSVALSEACSNAVQHGGTQAESYRVTASIHGDVCRIEVTDCGPGFPIGAVVPRPEPRELQSGGRGLRLIEALSDRVQFDNQPGSGGAVVTFDKILKWRNKPLLQAS
ncbi:MULTISPECIES: ATP-binding protein [unclassified Streptomyces]|uniref:ATP-binding protein n=1 Tax=Streptomyces johnsoniae TaxID=3075532 RepID=A0ABU2SAS5_9ACTN|nr:MULTISPECIES: ATP-binding protein [unclassified Streptomyces]MDT0445893.1 ATP-binding protein [Streptomyces sp. DSM 41886]ONK12725.1 Serine-protein kinase RsbW [Streptomyces sp. MP131-18]